MADRLEPPPRQTGDPVTDVFAFGQWLTALYKNFVLERGVVATRDQPAALVNPSTGGIEAFPVGSIIILKVSTDPHDLLGYGTWARIAEGQAIIGVDESDIDFNAADMTGGAKEATPTGTVSAPTFTGDALGTHSHGAGTLATDAHNLTMQGVTAGADFDAVTDVGDHTIAGSTDAASAGTPSGTISAAAFTGDPMSTLPPYLTRYIWERTA